VALMTGRRLTEVGRLRPAHREAVKESSPHLLRGYQKGKAQRLSSDFPTYSEALKRENVRENFGTSTFF
jgi:hypothetical protein